MDYSIRHAQAQAHVANVWFGSTMETVSHRAANARNTHTHGAVARMQSTSVRSQEKWQRYAGHK